MNGYGIKRPQNGPSRYIQLKFFFLIHHNSKGTASKLRFECVATLSMSV